MTDGPPDRLIVAFSPSDADHATKGHLWSLYNPALENPYDVPDGDERLRKAVERVDPHDYSLGDGEWWVRLDYESVVDDDRDPERIDAEGWR